MPTNEAMKAAILDELLGKGFGTNWRGDTSEAERCADDIVARLCLPALLAVAAAAREWREAFDSPTKGYGKGDGADKVNAAYDSVMERLDRISAAEDRLRAAIEIYDCKREGVEGGDDGQ